MTDANAAGRARTLAGPSSIVDVGRTVAVSGGSPGVTSGMPQYDDVKHLLNGLPLGHQRFQPLTRAVADVAGDQSADLSLGQAAGVIGVSVAFLARQIDAGELPSCGEGDDRRIGAADLARYRQAMYDRRSRALDELSALSQELGLP